MKKFIIETFGWYGTVAIIGAYALISFNLIKSASLFYQILNLTGALGIITVSYYKKVFQSVVLNLIWGIVAIIAIVSLLHH
ncbi:MAG TPA: hypothetical protein VF189_05810 [Patescibacteria group bacterium]